jgi:hypothetical protein
MMRHHFVQALVISFAFLAHVFFIPKAALATTAYDTANQAFEEAARQSLGTAPEADLGPLRCVSSASPLALINAVFYSFDIFIDPILGKFGRINFNLAELPSQNLVSLDLRYEECHNELMDARGQIRVRRIIETPAPDHPGYIFKYAPKGAGMDVVCWTF